MYIYIYIRQQIVTDIYKSDHVLLFSNQNDERKSFVFRLLKQYIRFNYLHLNNILCMGSESSSNDVTDFCADTDHWRHICSAYDRWSSYLKSVFEINHSFVLSRRTPSRALSSAFSVSWYVLSVGICFEWLFYKTSFEYINCI